MPRVDWDEWRHALDVFMWQAISLTMRLPQQDYEKWKVLEWPPVHPSFAWMGKLHDPYVERLRKATHGFRGATQVSLVSPKPGDPSWRVVSMPEFGAWVAALGWSVPDEFPWVAPATAAESVPTVVLPEPQRRLAALRLLGGDVKWWKCDWAITRIGKLVAQEKASGFARSSQKTISGDLKDAAEAEKREGDPATRRAGWGA